MNGSWQDHLVLRPQYPLGASARSDDTVTFALRRSTVTMKRLDAHANALLLIGASDIDLLGGMFDVMPDFKALLDAGYGEEIERNAGRFPGLHRYAVMLSNIAEGIADGSIRVPR